MWLRTDDLGYLRFDSVNHLVVHEVSETVWVIKADTYQLHPVYPTEAAAQEALNGLMAPQVFDPS